MYEPLNYLHVSTHILTNGLKCFKIDPSHHVTCKNNDDNNGLKWYKIDPSHHACYKNNDNYYHY